MSSNDTVNFLYSLNEAVNISDENGEIIMKEEFEAIHVKEQDVAKYQFFLRLHVSTDVSNSTLSYFYRTYTYGKKLQSSLVACRGMS